MRCCIRGAITVDTNTREDILLNTRNLLKEIINTNGLKIEDIISILFTATRDLDAAYPAVAARELGIVHASLMCAQEMYVVGSLEKCIRVQVEAEVSKSQNEVGFVYLKDAVKLRPDLTGKGKNIAVAIDGPAGSGKSTVAKELAAELGLIYVDTGAMYRSIGYKCLENDIDTSNEETVAELAQNINMEICYIDGKQRIFADAVDITDDIRTQEVADAASAVAKTPEVRRILVKLQREIAKNNNVIMDGRDIGSNVLPDAQVKIYLDADVSERAKRRCGELAQKGIEADFYKVLDEIMARDKQDKEREVNPLVIADDATIIDTTNMKIVQVKQEIAELIREAML